jgi:CRISPR-associated endonuclease/helicase Cas3
LWGKSNASGKVNLLLQHLLDAAAVAECLWDGYLAPAVRARIDDCCEGDGRSLLALLCGLHDVGKASPAFQVKVSVLADRVGALGLGLCPPDGDARRWHHSSAGAVVVRRALAAAGWSPAACAWVWPLVAGHHGFIGGEGIFERLRGSFALRRAQGRGEWERVQDSLVCRVASEVGVELGRLAPGRVPRRADQLAVSGLVIMADWIASDDLHFEGVCELAEVSMAGARQRAAAAWRMLGLRGGWDPALLPRSQDLLSDRFGCAARPCQRVSTALAEEMPAAGLVVIEAPMGEGKTEAALVAAEVLGRRFGADGVFVGMPTQATSDPMYLRVLAWAGSIDRGLPVALLHGKRRFNRAWRAAERQSRFSGVDDYGCDDDLYGPAVRVGRQRVEGFPAEWLLGRHRGLLSPFVVGTIDQLLHAATRTRRVMLRHAGLAGRVVVLDEVHAYDVYMSQFLLEALRWLGEARVPVVLLSATLPAAHRADLVGAYLGGATRGVGVDLGGLPEVSGYPSVTGACAADGVPWYCVRSAAGWRESMAVDVSVLDEPAQAGPERVVECLADGLREGGCALVIRNTVRRAQQTYSALREVFGEQVVLLHGRLVAGERAERTERVLGLLGPPTVAPGGAVRPDRLIVVATQLAEQSFDVDADLLVTDLAPIDLLLQRVGRLHRHNRDAPRPAPVRTPRVVVTGLTRHDLAPPSFPPGSRAVYGNHLLLRSAALVLRSAETGGWDVPAQVPALVAHGYSEEPLVPEPWRAAAEVAHRDWREQQNRRRANAEPFLLAGPALHPDTLAGLHHASTADLSDDEKVAAVVRDGEPSVEVILIRRDDRGEYRTLDGRALGPGGAAAVSDEEVMERLIAATVRLPARKDITDAALAGLRPLDGWTSDPWLRYARALELDQTMSASLGGHRLTYDTTLGLTDEREAR